MNSSSSHFTQAEQDVDLSVFAADFTRLLRDYPDVVSDRKKFAGLLKDFFPKQKKENNLLSSLYDLQIVAEIGSASNIDRLFASRFEKRLQDEYGVTPHDAAWAVETWCECYGKGILGKPCDIVDASSTGEKAPESFETPARPVAKGNVNLNRANAYVLLREKTIRFVSTVVGKTQPVYIVCFITGLILIGALWIYAINHKNEMGFAMLSGLAPVIALVEFHSLPGIGALILNGIAVVHSISLIWILILFFTDRPSNRTAIVFIDWIWVFCTGIILIILLWILFKGGNKKDDERHR